MGPRDDNDTPSTDSLADFYTDVQDVIENSIYEPDPEEVEEDEND